MSFEVNPTCVKPWSACVRSCRAPGDACDLTKAGAIRDLDDAEELQPQLIATVNP